jgi:hypothetical protein
MNDAARTMIGIILITVPTIEFGGYFLLTLLRLGRMGSFTPSPLQRSFFRAGHAHAGVLVILALVCQLVIGEARVAESVQWSLRWGTALAPILVSAGFFAAVPSPQMTKPGRGLWLIYAGALSLAVSTFALGIGLLLPPTV